MQPALCSFELEADAHFQKHFSSGQELQLIIFYAKEIITKGPD